MTALDQQVTAGDEGGTQETLEGMIQINAPIQPGDSGGALVDANGKVIGMNTAAAGGGQFNARVGSNVGFAIPIDNAVGIVSQIRSGTETDKVHIGDRALLGVQVQDLNGQNSPATSGALVVGVQPNTGAADAGIQTNDVLTTLNGKPISNSASLRLGLVKFHPGDSVSVGWVDASGNSPHRRREARRRPAALINVDNGNGHRSIVASGGRFAFGEEGAAWLRLVDPLRPLVDHSVETQPQRPVRPTSKEGSPDTQHGVPDRAARCSVRAPRSEVNHERSDDVLGDRPKATRQSDGAASSDDVSCDSRPELRRRLDADRTRAPVPAVGNRTTQPGRHLRAVQRRP